MNTFLNITLAALSGGVVSLLGGILLLYRKRLSEPTLHYLVSFAAGGMLAAAFLDLLPEALHEGGGDSVPTFALGGVLLFFLVEKFLLWHHHSHAHSAEEVKTVGPLIIIGDTLHNFLDGIAITITFLVSVPLGIVTTLAIIFHEIPQEIGDFAVLLDAGLKRAKVLLFNLASSLATLLGAWVALLFSESIERIAPQFLAITAGIFIYIAGADLIPEIHREKNRTRILAQVVSLIMGIIVIWLAVYLFHE